MSDFRIYEPHELGNDGYPWVWHELAHRNGPERVVGGSGVGVKDLVRHQAGNRCVRCGHPYVVGKSGGFEVAGQPSAAPAAAIEQFAALASASELKTEEKLKGVHWSACDERCTHGGPVRWRILGGWTKDDHVTDVQSIGIPEVDVQAAWRILTVHHLNGRKHDLRWWNLVSLCQRCHLYVQRKVQMERVYPWEHSEWFRPYAAGWYSYAYEGVDRPRDEVMADMDRLLALERVA